MRNIRLTNSEDPAVYLGAIYSNIIAIFVISIYYIKDINI